MIGGTHEQERDGTDEAERTRKLASDQEPVPTRGNAPGLSDVDGSVLVFVPLNLDGSARRAVGKVKAGTEPRHYRVGFDSDLCSGCL